MTKSYHPRFFEARGLGDERRARPCTSDATTGRIGGCRPQSIRRVHEVALGRQYPGEARRLALARSPCEVERGIGREGPPPLERTRHARRSKKRSLCS